MAVLDNMVAFWELGEASGTRNDSFGTNHLTDHGVGQITGKVGNAARFNPNPATGQYLSCADNAALSLGPDTPFTLVGWFYVNLIDVLSQFNTILCKRETSGAQPYEYRLQFDFSSGFISFSVTKTSGTDFGSVTNTTTIASGSWYFVCAWHDPVADTLNLQINSGTAASTTGYTFGTIDTTGEFWLGADPLGTGYWPGYLDQWGLWKRVLISTERTWLYNSGAGRSYADLVAFNALSTVFYRQRSRR